MQIKVVVKFTPTSEEFWQPGIYRWPPRAGWIWSSEWALGRSRRGKDSRRSRRAARCWWWWRRGWRGTRPKYRPRPETPRSSWSRFWEWSWWPQPSTPARCRRWTAQRWSIQWWCRKYSSQRGETRAPPSESRLREHWLSACRRARWETPPLATSRTFPSWVICVTCHLHAFKKKMHEVT